MLLHSSCHHTSKLGQILHLAAPQYTAYIIVEEITILAQFLQMLTDFGATVCKTVRPMLLDLCLSCLSVCNVGVFWPNGWMDQDETWHGGRPRAQATLC